MRQEVSLERDRLTFFDRNPDAQLGKAQVTPLPLPDWYHPRQSGVIPISMHDITDAVGHCDCCECSLEVQLGVVVQKSWMVL